MKSESFAMRYVIGAALLFLSSASMAQPLTSVSMRFNVGVGISNKPAVLFGAPFALSGELSTTLRNRWRIAVEGGVMGFRDAKYPDNKIGLIFSSYSRYSHRYFGLLIGHSLLNVDRPNSLFLSVGADYLLIVDPNVKSSSGLLAGYYFDYRYERYLNIPVQLDYSIRPFRNKKSKLAFIGRWNFNAFHSYPTLCVGLDIPIYHAPDRWF